MSRLLLGLLVAALLAAGCATADEEMAAVTATCGAVEQRPDRGHQHLVPGAGGEPVFSEVPPTSGWHHGDEETIRAALGVHGPDDPISEVDQVSVLAVDGVVVAHGELDDAPRRSLADLVAGSDRVVALTPYDRLDPGEVALTAWATAQRCDGVDTDAVSAFIDEHAAAEPDFTMGGHADQGEHGAHGGHGGHGGHDDRLDDEDGDHHDDHHGS